MEVLIEELIDLHASCPSFRQIFKSQQTTQQFSDAYKAFVSAVSSCASLNNTATRILEKMTHFGLTLALDPAGAGAQIREVCLSLSVFGARIDEAKILDVLQAAETILHPNSEKPEIDPTLITDGRSIRTRLASSRISMQLGERTLAKSLMRMQEWRSTIIASERKRLRKNMLDL